MVFRTTKCFKLRLFDDTEGVHYAFTDGPTDFPRTLVRVTYYHGVNHIN